MSECRAHIQTRLNRWANVVRTVRICSSLDVAYDHMECNKSETGRDRLAHGVRTDRVQTEKMSAWCAHIPSLDYTSLCGASAHLSVCFLFEIHCLAKILIDICTTKTTVWLISLCLCLRGNKKIIVWQI